MQTHTNNISEPTENIDTYQFEPIQGYPMLTWKGKRPFRATQFYPAQLKEVHGEEVEGWRNKIYWGDNLQVMSHLLKTYRGQITLIYIDPPFDSNADYKKTIQLRGRTVENDRTAFEEKQYTDIWTNDEYLQFMYERLILLRELLADNGSIYLHCDPTMSHYLKLIMDEVFGNENFRNEIVWHYKHIGSTQKDFARKHDTLLRYAKSNNLIFNADAVRQPYDEKTVRRYEKPVVFPGGYKAALNPLGKLCDDVWELPPIRNVSSERLGYPTQKPEALLERIIKASSNPGDIVFDCFMGSGTTQAVAMKLGRRFIGADINLGAVETTTKRLLHLTTESQENLIITYHKYSGGGSTDPLHQLRNLQRQPLRHISQPRRGKDTPHRSIRNPAPTQQQSL